MAELPSHLGCEESVADCRLYVRRDRGKRVFGSKQNVAIFDTLLPFWRKLGKGNLQQEESSNADGSGAGSKGKRSPAGLEHEERGGISRYAAYPETHFDRWLKRHMPQPIA